MVSRGICRPPGSAARSLLEWGIDLWPYVNGRAIVNGLQLSSMNSTDMLDVLHYFFEDDLNYSTAEQAEARDKMRASLYGQLYNTTYRYSSGANSSRTARNFDVDEEIKPVELKERKVDSFNPAIPPKPYVAPTPVNVNSAKPFGSVLDAPLS